VRHTSIICPVCKELVEIIDRAMVDHGNGCPASGMHYVRSPRGYASGPQIVAAKFVDNITNCDYCGADHGPGLAMLVKVPNPANN
jgi:hypothetical protein